MTAGAVALLSLMRALGVASCSVAWAIRGRLDKIDSRLDALEAANRTRSRRR